MDLHNIRESYNFDSLEESKVNRDPMIQFNHWFTQYKLWELRITMPWLFQQLGEMNQKVE